MDREVSTELDLITETILRTVPVERIYLFGSYATGESRENSDLDIYVVMSDDAPLRATDAMTLINEAIYPFKTTPTDIFVSKKSRFENRRGGHTIEREAANKGTVLYG
jgi:predicted nucleotidyltransferase